MQDRQTSRSITCPTIVKPSTLLKSISLQINRTAKTKYKKELVIYIQEFIEVEGYKMPTGTILAEKDPRVYSYSTE
jgi:hypothetical protein